MKLDTTEKPAATSTIRTQMAWPSSHWVLAPKANRLVNRAGAKARMTLDPVRARALRVPSTRGLGDTALRASWMAVKDMLMPQPTASRGGAMAQKAVTAPARRSMLPKGHRAKKTG